MRKILLSLTLISIGLVLTGFGGRNPNRGAFKPSGYRYSDQAYATRGDGSRHYIPGESFLNGTCKSVWVDCLNHRITIEGANVSEVDQIIDCGARGKTKNGTGYIGGRHSARVVKDGVAIEGIPGMGQSGGGKVFHTPWWKAPPMPAALNGSKGCIRTSPNVLEILKSCKGAPLTISGAADRGGSVDEPSGRSRGKSKTRR